jgi:hypothetical protein
MSLVTHGFSPPEIHVGFLTTEVEAINLWWARKFVVICYSNHRKVIIITPGHMYILSCPWTPPQPQLAHGFPDNKASTLDQYQNLDSPALAWKQLFTLSHGWIGVWVWFVEQFCPPPVWALLVCVVGYHWMKSAILFSRFTTWDRKHSIFTPCYSDPISTSCSRDNAYSTDLPYWLWVLMCVNRKHKVLLTKSSQLAVGLGTCSVPVHEKGKDGKAEGSRAQAVMALL